MEITKKEFVHKDVELCPLCKKEIITKTQSWVAVIDYLGENHQKTGVYHRVCLDDLLKAKGEIVQDRLRNSVGKTIRGLFGGQMPKQFDMNQPRPEQFGMNQSTPQQSKV